MKKEIEEFEYNGLKFSVEELDSLQEIEFADAWNELCEYHNKALKKAPKNYATKQLKLLIELFKIPKIIYDGEIVEDIAFFLKKITVSKSLSLYNDVANIGVVRPEDEGK